MVKSLILTLSGLLLFFIFSIERVKAQDLLNRPITIVVEKKKLREVLNEVSDLGSFNFSYDGRLIHADSLVTLQAVNQPISNILHQLFDNSYHLEERDNYLIITRSLPRLSIINTDLITENNSFSISGDVISDQSRERLINVSVYEKTQLVSTLTDNHGHFQLKFKSAKYRQLTVRVSKFLYRDTSINILSPAEINSHFSVDDRVNYQDKDNRVERTGMGRLFITTRQKIQGMNIADFFTTRPFQVSLTPGLSSHKMLSPQVVNKFSLNLAGGYTAGTNGLEFGGLFNINKQSAQYVQIAGIFNLVGGNATGVQFAGAHNSVLDTLKGLQLSLFSNKAETQVSGVQISALHNETGKLKGLQIGLVNFADTSTGASIGLVNIIRNGFYKVTVSANDLSTTNISLKTGTHRFYSALLASANISSKNKFYAFGFGIGHDFIFTDQLYLSAEADYLFGYTGALDDRWLQGKLLLNLQLSKGISLVAGPNYNKYSYSGSVSGYKEKFRLPDHYVWANAKPIKRWIGWEAGVAFNSSFKPAKKISDYSTAWYLEMAATLGKAWDQPYGLVSGAELGVQRDLGENLVSTLTTGYTHISADPAYIFAIIGNDYYHARSQNILPLKAGIRLKFGKTLYLGSEFGGAFGQKKLGITTKLGTINRETYVNETYRSMMYSVSTGFAYNSGLELGIKFEDYGLQTQYKQIALRVGYRIKLTK